MTSVTAPFSTLFPRGVDPKEVISLLSDYGTLPKDVGRIVIGYMINAFGPSEWREFREINVGDAHSLSDEDINFLLGQDPVDPSLKAWQTHRVVYGSRMFTLMGSPQEVPRTLKTLQFGKLGVRYKNESEALRQNIVEMAKDSSWLIFRVGVLGRNESTEKQKEITANFGYESLPSAIDVVTVFSCINAWTGERPLLNPQGKNCVTYTRTSQIVRFEKTFQVVVGEALLEKSVVITYSFNDKENFGVACLAKSPCLLIS